MYLKTLYKAFDRTKEQIFWNYFLICSTIDQASAVWLGFSETVLFL